MLAVGTRRRRARVDLEVRRTDLIAGTRGTERCRDFGLQVLTKFPQHGLTQKIGIVFPGFCKLGN